MLEKRAFSEMLKFLVCVCYTSHSSSRYTCLWLLLSQAYPGMPKSTKIILTFFNIFLIFFFYSFSQLLTVFHRSWLLFFSQFWQILDHFWQFLNHFGLFCIVSDSVCLFWLFLTHFGTLLTVLTVLGSFWKFFTVFVKFLSFSKFFTVRLLHQHSCFLC